MLVLPCPVAPSTEKIPLNNFEPCFSAIASALFVSLISAGDKHISGATHNFEKNLLRVLNSGVLVIAITAVEWNQTEHSFGVPHSTWARFAHRPELLKR